MSVGEVDQSGLPKRAKRSLTPFCRMARQLRYGLINGPIVNLLWFSTRSDRCTPLWRDLFARGTTMWLLAILFLSLMSAFVPGVLAQEPLPVPSPIEPGSASEFLHPTTEALDNNKALDNEALDARVNPVLACLRIPAVLITEVASRDFTHTSPVDRVILGTHSRGTAICNGQVSCEMREQTGAAEVVCRISGTVDSTTRGTNGPALIGSTATTSYTATKSIVFNGQKLVTQPALVQASSRIRITDVDSSLPGLRGRIVRRVAERRSSQSLAQAEDITRDLTASELQQNIDHEFAQRIDSINRKLEERLPILTAFVESDYKLSISSQPEFIQLMFVHRDAGPQALNFPSTLPLTSKVVLWIPLPNPMQANARDLEAEQRESKNNFVLQESEQWLLDNTKSFLPIWLTAAVTRVTDKINQRTQRIDLLTHENWIGVQFGQSRVK